MGALSPCCVFHADSHSRLLCVVGNTMRIRVQNRRNVCACVTMNQQQPTEHVEPTISTEPSITSSPLAPSITLSQTQFPISFVKSRCDICCVNHNSNSHNSPTLLFLLTLSLFHYFTRTLKRSRNIICLAQCTHNVRI